MTRHSFGGDLGAWTVTSGAGNAAVLASAATITFWTAKTGGSQLTDLAGAADGSSPMSQVITSTGSDGYPVGSIPQFWGPDGVTSMWASANAGPRSLIQANDMLATVANVNVAQTFSQPQTYGPIGDVNANRIILYAEAAGQVGDVLVAYSGSDTGQGGARQRTMYLNEKGELRVIAAKTNSVAVRFKGQPGQTANVMEHTDTSNVPVSWMAADGSWRAPNLGHILPFSISGALTVQTGAHRIYNDTGVPLTIRSVRASVGTAPTGAAIRVDVNKNGTSIFTTQGNRPNIAVSTFTSKVTNMDVTSIADGEYLTVDVDVIGSTVAGSDLTVAVLCY